MGTKCSQRQVAARTGRLAYRRRVASPVDASGKAFTIDVLPWAYVHQRLVLLLALKGETAILMDDQQASNRAGLVSCTMYARSSRNPPAGVFFNISASPART